VKDNKGLYRYSVGLTTSEPQEPELIFADDNLGGFTCDPPNFRVLIADRGNNSMLMISLDGYV